MLDKNIAYMIRNDGEICNAGETHPYFTSINDFQDVQIWANSPSNRRALNFLLNNTQYQNVKEEVNSILQADKSEESLVEYCKNCYHNLNQEFLRARFGGEYFYTSDSSIYFRISSQRFNWFNIIWEFVYKNKKQIADVTVEHDSMMFIDDKKYLVNGIELTHIPTEDFLTLPGNPIVESLNNSFEDNYFLKNLRAGKSIYESAETLPSHRARVIFESTFTPELLEYDLRYCLQK